MNGFFAAMDLGLVWVSQIVAQLALLFLLACMVHLVFTGKPRMQYFNWLAVMVVTCLLLPLQFCVPTWKFEVQTQTAALPASVEAPIFENSTVAVPPTSQDIPTIDFDTDRSAAAPVNLELNETHAAGANTLPDGVETGQTAGAGQAVRHFPKLPSISQLLLIGYIAVAFFLGCRMLLGVIALRRLAASASKLDANELATTVFDSMKITRRPEVRISADVQIPMAFGIIKPTILLPLDFLRWDTESQRAVLIHEACHVRRFDALWDLIARVACTAYWFHPAVHQAGRFLRLTRERATDVMVLEQGMSATQYATQLLDIAAAAQKPRQAAMFMACDGDIKNRIKAILSSGNFESSSRVRSFVAKVCIATTFTLLAGVSIQLSFASVDQQAEEKKPPKQNVQIVGDTYYQRIEQIKARDTSDSQFDDSKISVTGRVTDHDGKPVKNAIVVLRDDSSIFVPGDGAINDVIAKTRSDGTGLYQFRNVPNPSTASWNRFWGIIAVSETGMGVCQRKVCLNPGGQYDNMDVRLKRLVDVTGRVVAPSGRPLENAQIRIAFFCEPVDGFDSQTSFSDRQMNPRAATNENGEFTLRDMPAGVIAGLTVLHPDFPEQLVTLRTTKDHPEFIIYRGLPRTRPQENGLEIQLKEGMKVTGRVVDQAGKAREGIRVSIRDAVSTSGPDGDFSLITGRAASPSDTSREIMTYSKTDRFTISTEVKLSELRSGALTIEHPVPTKVLGKVVSLKSETPVPGVEVTFRTQQRRFFYGRTSDKQGKFEETLAGKVSIELRSRNRNLLLHQAQISGLECTKTATENESPSPLGATAVKLGELDLGFGGTKELIIRIPTKNSCKAVVLDRSGNPVAGAQVGFCSNFGGLFTADATSDTDGVAAFDSFKEEPAWSNFLLARHDIDGQLYWAEVDTRTPKDTYELKLEPAIPISGTISVEAQPIAGATISITKDNGSRPRQLIAKVSTDNQGRYSAQLPARGYDGQQPTYRISLEPSELIPNQAVGMSVKKALGNADRLRADLDLIRGQGKIAGTVVDAKGEPVANAVIQVHSMLLRKPGKPMHEFQGWQLFGKSSCFSDDSGAFEIDGLPTDYLAILTAKTNSSAIGGTLMTRVGNQSATLLVTDGSESKLDSQRLRR